MRVLAPRDGLVRIIVAEIVKRERNALKKSPRLLHGFGRLRVKPRHFRRRLQTAFGVGREASTGRVQRRLFANAGQNVRERAASWHMKKRLRRRDKACAGFRRRRAKQGETATVLAVEAKARGEPDLAAARPRLSQGLAQPFIRR